MRAVSPIARGLLLSIGAAPFVGLLASDAGAAVDPAIASVWNTKCAACHGKDGKGQTVMGGKMGVEDMTTAAWQSKFSDAQIKSTISDGLKRTKDGKNQEMKPFKDKLDPAQIDGLAKFVRAFGPAPAAKSGETPKPAGGKTEAAKPGETGKPAAPAAGGAAPAPDKNTLALWKKSCSGCHGPDGKGATAQGKKLKAPDMTDPAWQSAHDAAQIKQLLSNPKAEVKGAGGKPMKHPSPKAKPEQIDALAAYVKSLGKK